MRTTKAYWQWDEALNCTSLKLGMNITEVLNDKFIYPDTENAENYDCVDPNVWKVKVLGNKIESIWYVNNYFPLICDNLWDMKHDEFIRTVSAILKPATLPLEGDILYVIFRGSFATLIALMRR